jgi:hypothetical protein
VARGDGVAVFIANSAIAATVSSVVDTRGNTYTASANSPATGSNRRTWIYVCAATGTNGLRAGDTITVTFASGAAYAVRAVNLHAVKTSGAADKATAGASATSTAPSSGSTGTLAQADELELGLIATDGVTADTFTIGGGFTTAGSVFNTATANIGLYPAYKIVTATTGDTYSATITSRAWVASVATYRAGTFPDSQRLAGLEVEADLSGGSRALAGLVAEYDWRDPVGLTLTTTQAQAASVSVIVTPGGPILCTVVTTQAQVVTLGLSVVARPVGGMLALQPTRVRLLYAVIRHPRVPAPPLQPWSVAGPPTLAPRQATGAPLLVPGAEAGPPPLVPVLYGAQ